MRTPRQSGTPVGATAIQPSSSPRGSNASPPSAATIGATTAGAIAGIASSDTGTPSSATCPKLAATSGHVASVAAADTIVSDAAHPSNRARHPADGERHPPWLPSQTVRASAIPATAAKLNWKLTCRTRLGETAVITAAARARAGNTPEGLPNAKAARYTVPIVADLSAEGGAPDTIA